MESSASLLSWCKDALSKSQEMDSELYLLTWSSRARVVKKEVKSQREEEELAATNEQPTTTKSEEVADGRWRKRRPSCVMDEKREETQALVQRDQDLVATCLGPCRVNA